MTRSTVRLTMAQALVRYLCNQFTEIDGERVPLFAGVFAIFGHGNVTCLREALEAVQDTLPTWRGQNEQSMALAAIGFAKAKRRRQIMVAASSIGPGRHEHGHRRRPRPRESPAGAAPRRRHLRQPPARPGDAAGRAFRKPDDHRERRLQAGLPLLGPDRAARADHRLAAAGGGGDARPGRLRAGLPVALPGHPGNRLRLSRGLLRADASGRSRARAPTATGWPRRWSSSRPRRSR